MLKPRKATSIGQQQDKEDTNRFDNRYLRISAVVWQIVAKKMHYTYYKQWQRTLYFLGDDKSGRKDKNNVENMWLGPGVLLTQACYCVITAE